MAFNCYSSSCPTLSPLGEWTDYGCVTLSTDPEREQLQILQQTPGPGFLSYEIRGGNFNEDNSLKILLSSAGLATRTSINSYQSLLGSVDYPNVGVRESMCKGSLAKILSLEDSQNYKKVVVPTLLNFPMGALLLECLILSLQNRGR